jgi:hypothetical protein
VVQAWAVALANIFAGDFGYVVMLTVAGTHLVLAYQAWYYSDVGLNRYRARARSTKWTKGTCSSSSCTATTSP